MITIGDKQTQSAGDNSQQLQATNMVVSIGIDEKRAREIYQEMNLQLRKDYSEEAYIIANSRVSEFESKLLPKMEAVDGALEAFADPSFQLLLVEAQKTAASTERPADYDLLAELLIHRFQNNENRVTRAGISRAVEIVDEISDDALLALTVIHSVHYFFPATGVINQGLNILNDLFGKLFYSTLPQGSDWLDHLDILDAVRLNNFSGLKKIEQYYSEMLSGYTDVGIKKNSDNYNRAIELLRNSGLPQNILIEHELNNDFVRVNLSDKNQVESLQLQQQIFNVGQLSIRSIALTEIQKITIKSIYGLYDKDSKLRDENIKKFMEEWDKQPNLRKLKEWWNTISVGFKLTSVGKVLAHSNAQRCDKNLPPFN